MLRSMANTLDTILYIGKEGVTEATVKEAYDALEARELIKVRRAEQQRPDRQRGLRTCCASARTPSLCSVSVAAS